MWNIEKVVKKGDYLYAVVRDHPNRTSRDYVLMHRVVAENRLGRLLSSDEVVHHVDGNKKNNSDDNLEVMTKWDHNRMHSSTGKKMVKLVCAGCMCCFDIEKRQTHLIKKNTKLPTSCSKKCRGWLSVEVATGRMSLGRAFEISSSRANEEYTLTTNQ